MKSLMIAVSCLMLLLSFNDAHAARKKSKKSKTRQSHSRVAKKPKAKKTMKKSTKIQKDVVKDEEED